MVVFGPLRYRVLGGAADPTTARGHEAGQGNHLQSRHQPFGGRSQFPEFVLQGWEESRLKHVSELRDLLAKCKLQVGLPKSLLCIDSNSLTPRGPFSKQNQSVLFYSNNFTHFCKRLM